MTTKAIFEPNYFEPKDQNFTERVKKSFDRQQVMGTLGASLTKVKPGAVEISMPYNKSFTQQHGFVHAGITTTLLDSAAGYAAFSLMDENAAILTIEFKNNLLLPAKGELFIAKGVVVKPGRTITVAEAEAFAIDNGEQKHIATLSATLMAVYNRDDVKH